MKAQKYSEIINRAAASMYTARTIVDRVQSEVYDTLNPGDSLTGDQELQLDGINGKLMDVINEMVLLDDELIEIQNNMIKTR